MKRPSTSSTSTSKYKNTKKEKKQNLRLDKLYDSKDLEQEIIKM